ncbi:MAG TPA: hypothetical protein VFS43_26645 [Polyangiaceae bacterium]|nr:hypothetical protein [Polyangiaceae bacterium]
MLAAKDASALGRLFSAGRTPRALAALDGHPRGRMLAVRGLDHGPVAGALRALAGGAAFPWGGKSFASAGGAEGTGVNRVRLGGRHALFPFRTRLGASVIDGAPAVVLDYDLPDNPAVIRAIHDEVRLVDEGLWLGPAMLKTARGPRLVLWFALDALRPDAPVGHAGRDGRSGRGAS